MDNAIKNTSVTIRRLRNGPKKVELPFISGPPPMAVLYLSSKEVILAPKSEGLGVAESLVEFSTTHYIVAFDRI
jgi:hypothetical protein